MSITVLDTYSAMRRSLLAPVADRADLLRSMLEANRGMYRYSPVEVDLVALHLQSSGFPIDRDEERCLDALETLAAAGAWERMQRALDNALAVLLEATPGFEAPDITVLFVLGDPADKHFMGPCKGVTGFGGISGNIAITFWPYPENVERLETTAVHELHHNLRWSPGGVVWDPMTVTVGEHIVGEGLADAFARQLYGDDLGHSRIGVPHLHDDEVFAKVLTGLDVTGMHNFTAWVHGDPGAENLGVTPVGLPMGAGYAAGNRLVDAYLAATGKTAAQALHADSAEIIATTLRRG
ncbi:peptidase [Nonomuraea sp. RK-328]|nr:peptidase [Nonomuraea sp. RK-328]